ncbi:hypothetical protein BH11BAC3_BH11BAC3_33690 [soil metagenome]
MFDVFHNLLIVKVKCLILQLHEKNKWNYKENCQLGSMAI